MTVKRILLFGSRARGDARQESDWDFLVIISTPISREAKNDTILRIRRRLVHSLSSIDIIVKTEERIEKERNDYGFITAHAIEEGVPV